MGRKVTQYLNNVSVTPDDLSLIDVSEKIGVASYESRKWTLSAFTAWIKSKIGTTAGTLNKVSKFGADGTLVDSMITDDGTKIGINSNPTIGSKINITSDETKGINLVTNGSNINTGIGIKSTAEGTNNIANIGIFSQALNGVYSTTGLQGWASSDNGLNIGVEGISTGTSTNIGLRGYASDGSINYSVQLQDGTQQIGRFLKSITSDGKGNWANISSSDINDLRYINDYSSNSWDEDILYVNHNLNTLSPTVFCYVNNNLAEFEISTIDENNLLINKNNNTITPTSMRVGIS
jgi:hypothetical protein